MKLRIRASTGVSTLEVDPQLPLAQLKAQLQAKSLRSGFPPKPLKAPEDAPVSAVLSNGDMLIVETAAELSPKTQPKAARPSESSILSNGSLTIRVVPDDNSCLFRSVCAILGQSSSSPRQLRAIIRDAIAKDSVLYSDAFLGRSNMAYQQWIMSENAWGGAIELSILSQHFKIEFAAFDIKTMRMDRYGEGNSCTNVGYLVYDGIHYNYVALALGSGLTPDTDVTQFDVNDTLVMQHVRKLVQKEKDAKRFTDTANFVLNCGQCGAKLRGEAEALEHAKNTGHSQFSEN